MSSLSNCLLPPLRRSLLTSDATSHKLSPTPSELATDQEQRRKFLLFVKIVFRYLRVTRNIQLLNRAQKLVHIMVREHRNGDPHFEPLFENVETRLRLLVGEYHWRRAHRMMRYYLQKKQQDSSVHVVFPDTLLGGLPDEIR